MSIHRLIGDSTNTGRGITWLWGPMAYGLEIAWSQRRHWFLGYDKGWPT
jgi:hypothetical protein